VATAQIGAARSAMIGVEAFEAGSMLNNALPDGSLQCFGRATAVIASEGGPAGRRFEESNMSQVKCERCGQTADALDKAPLRNELGERVLKGICKDCWAQWLRYQTALINHNGLDVREKPAREFLTTNMRAFLFGTGDAEEIDTSKQGTISW
jgi:Fe-S cluster biosynthesis and repair protein YggX